LGSETVPAIGRDIGPPTAAEQMADEIPY
jgi:hypothetical protein